MNLRTFAGAAHAVRLRAIALSFGLTYASLAHGSESEPLTPAPLAAVVLVEGARALEIGTASSASTGSVTRAQLQARSVYRAGELLEATPGLIVSQHSGEGKANQFYLRGFNLDHGTDLRTTIDGMLVNQRSHAHGQGWSDLNFLIPELAARMEYKKGPFYASEGDFASAGSVQLTYANKLDSSIGVFSVGEHGHRRALLAGSPEAGYGNLLYAVELLRNDGPYVNPDRYKKRNAVLRYSQGSGANGFAVTAMAYRADWNATDQIPWRALGTEHLASRYNTIDATDGGAAHRYSLSAAAKRSGSSNATAFNAYVVHSELDLYSNFTYFLDNPIDGDQFSQPDRRVTSGLSMNHTWQVDGWASESENTVGVQLQNDNISNGLHNTRVRKRISTVRQDHVHEVSAGVYAENASRWNAWFRTHAGVRFDHYRFKVEGDRLVNSGQTTDSIVSPKFSLIFGPWANSEFYVNIGRGFHSNDARGTTITVDPKTGDPIDRVTPLVNALGMELGARTVPIHGLQSTLSLYRLEFDSELLFVGDAGTTEAGRPSRRTGFELSNYYKPNKWLSIDADIAYARARFRGYDPAGSHIPGAIEGVVSLAMAVDNVGQYFGALQLRHFGPRALIEDNSVRSKATTMLNGRIGYKLNKHLHLELEGFNLANRRDSAIDYYYTSRLPGESAEGVDDVHFHPIEPRSFRLTLRTAF